MKQYRQRIAVYDEDTDDLLGYAAEDTAGWQALTIFGYPFARVLTQSDAETAVRRDGRSVLKNVWQYFDSDDRQWYFCTLQQIFETRVMVERTNARGYMEPQDRKAYTVTDPSEENLMLNY